MKSIIIIIALILVSSLLGCSFITEPLKFVVKKAYIVSLKLDSVVQNLSPETIVKNSNKIRNTLTVINTALKLIDKKLSNPDVNIELQKTIHSIENSIELLEDVTLDNLEETKIELGIYLTELKSVIEDAAEFMKVELPIISSQATSNEECIEELDRATKELEKALKK